MSEPAFDFSSLNPNIILDALQENGIQVESGLIALNSYENRVYQFSNEKKHRYVVKFYRPQRWSEAQILEEHQFARDLWQDNIPVSLPLTFILTFINTTLPTYKGFYFAVFPWLAGQQYETDNLEQLASVGGWLGRLHNCGRKRVFHVRPVINFADYIEQSVVVLMQCNLVPASLRKSFANVLERLTTALQQYWHTQWLPLRIHGDCHQGNMLWRERPLFIDLDDARMGLAIQDMWMLISGNHQEQRQQWNILLETYQEFSEFDTKELSLIEPLRAMRMVYYLAWVVRRWRDPAFPANFCWMTDEDFWQRQIVLFTEQERILHERPLQLISQY